MDEADRIGFEEFLTDERRLGKRTIKLYMIYYNLFNPLELSEPYIHKFILKHKNNPVVRAFVKNY
jgi:hypothetical protein